MRFSKALKVENILLTYQFSISSMKVHRQQRNNNSGFALPEILMIVLVPQVATTIINKRLVMAVAFSKRNNQVVFEGQCRISRAHWKNYQPSQK